MSYKERKQQSQCVFAKNVRKNCKKNDGRLIDTRLFLNLGETKVNIKYEYVITNNFLLF